MSQHSPTDAGRVGLAWQAVGLSAVAVVVVLWGAGLWAERQYSEYSRSPRTASVSRLKQLVLATLIYAESFDGHLPLDLRDSSAEWLHGTSRQPGRHQGQPVRERYRLSQELTLTPGPNPEPYIGNGRIAGRALASLEPRTVVPVFWEPKPYVPGKRALGTLDGAAKVHPEADFLRVLTDGLRKTPRH